METKSIYVHFAHFIGENGFEACIERNKNQFRTGWKSPKGTEFAFVRCPFKPKGHPFANINYRTGEKIRLTPWTTFSIANKNFLQMIKEHKNVNFV